MIKTTLFVLFGLIAPVWVFAQKPIMVTPKVQEVTVYLSGAEIRFKESIPLKKGENTIIFRGLSPSLVQNSVQIATGSGAEMLSIATQADQLLPEEISPKFKALKDSITSLEEQVVLIMNQIDAFDMEKKTLLQNQHIGGAQVGVSLVELTKAADFFRERTLKINTSLNSLNKSLNILNTRLTQKKENLNSELKKVSATRYDVEVVVSSKAEQPVDFAIRYLASNASWEASYDIIATEINKPVTLKYKAQVYNDTNIDWRDVKLSLSTGDISLNASRPFLTTWILNYTSSANEGYLNNMAQNLTRNESSSGETEEKSVSELNTSFDIAQRHSIRADGQPYRISLQEESLQALFEYLTIPKMELSAFLLAKVTGWEKLNLIDGTANVYFGNTFIGESNINTRLIGDTLELSLGRDNQIVVSRTKVEDKGNTPSLVGKRSESFVYEIRLKNNRKVPVPIRVQDQVPVSQEKDITVEVEDISGANLDAPSGRLQWIKSLGSGENAQYRIAFTVRYPKNQHVNIRKSRMVKSPRYR